MKALLIIADLDVPYTALAKVATCISSFFQVILRGSSFSLAIFHPHPPFLVQALHVVVQKVDNTIHLINLYPLDSTISPILIRWIVIYPVDNDIQCLNNLGRNSLWTTSSTPALSRKFMEVQSNLFHTDTKGTEPSVRFTEVYVL